MARRHRRLQSRPSSAIVSRRAATARHLPRSFMPPISSNRGIPARATTPCAFRRTVLPTSRLRPSLRVCSTARFKIKPTARRISLRRAHRRLLADRCPVGRPAIPSPRLVAINGPVGDSKIAGLAGSPASQGSTGPGTAPPFLGPIGKHAWAAAGHWADGNGHGRYGCARPILAVGCPRRAPASVKR
jgi:hypothetical protein